MSDLEYITCPHCCTEIDSRAKVCLGCGAELVVGPRYIETFLGGLVGFILFYFLAYYVSQNNNLINTLLPFLESYGGISSVIENNKVWIRLGSFIFGFLVTFFVMRKKRRFARKYNNK